MSDQELQNLAQQLHEMLLGKTQAIRCNMGDEIVREHTKVLATLQSDVSHILNGITEINKKLETSAENYNIAISRIQDVSGRVGKLENDKKNIIAIVGAILVCGYEIGKEILFKKL